MRSAQILFLFVFLMASLTGFATAQTEEVQQVSTLTVHPTESWIVTSYFGEATVYGFEISLSNLPADLYRLSMFGDYLHTTDTEEMLPAQIYTTQDFIVWEFSAAEVTGALTFHASATGVHILLEECIDSFALCQPVVEIGDNYRTIPTEGEYFFEKADPTRLPTMENLVVSAGDYHIMADFDFMPRGGSQLEFVNELCSGDFPVNQSAQTFNAVEFVCDDTTVNVNLEWWDMSAGRLTAEGYVAILHIEYWDWETGETISLTRGALNGQRLITLPNTTRLGIVVSKLAD